VEDYKLENCSGLFKDMQCVTCEVRAESRLVFVAETKCVTCEVRTECRFVFVAPSRQFKVIRRFGATCCLYLQIRKMSEKETNCQAQLVPGTE
jgi:hypothetical protein